MRGLPHSPRTIRAGSPASLPRAPAASYCLNVPTGGRDSTQGETMKRQTFAAIATAALFTPQAVAAPTADVPAPYETTFEVGPTVPDGGRSWTTTTSGAFTQPAYSKDGLVHHEVLGHQQWNTVAAPEGEDTRPILLGMQNDDETDWIYRGCPDTRELAGPARFGSDERSFFWAVDPDYDPFKDEDDLPVPGTYQSTGTATLDDQLRAVSVRATGCLPSGADRTYTYTVSTSHFVRTAPGEFTKVGVEVRGGTANEGGDITFRAEPGWEFLEKLSGRTRPEGMTDALWADQLVAEGVVPADKRWYVANEAPTDGPIVDTGWATPERSTDTTALGLAGLALLGAGGLTVAGARRR